MTKKFLLVANWKMNVTFGTAIAFAKEHSDSLVNLVKNKNVDFVICPSLHTMHTMKTIFSETCVKVGAQVCSEHGKGNFTGQVSAQSLHQAGCDFCIIGHSEQRQYNGVTDEQVTKKFIHLVDFDISPIVCIGESEEVNKSGKTIEALEKQISGILDAIPAMKIPEHLTISIAYEPTWSIGTGDVPSADHLEMVFAWLRSKIQNFSSSIRWRLLYGGSVTPDNIASIARVEDIDGFLIGNASQSFEEIEQMINKVTEVNR